MNRGFSILELIIGFGIVIVLLPAMVKAYNLFSTANGKNFDTFTVMYLNEEAQEAVRYMRDQNWTNNIASLSNNTWYGLEFSTTTNAWLSSTTEETIDGRFVRRFKVETLRRSSNGATFSTSTGTAMPHARFVTTEVQWNDRGKTYVKRMQSVIFNIFNT